MMKGVSTALAVTLALHQQSHRMRSAIRHAFSEQGCSMTTEEYFILSYISAKGTEQTQLRLMTAKDKTNITRLLDRLVAKGWVERTNHASSRRQQVIKLTETGVAIQSDANKVVETVTQQACDQLSAAEVHQLLDLLMALNIH